jgi:hypothetical protein
LEDPRVASNEWSWAQPVWLGSIPAASLTAAQSTTRGLRSFEATSVHRLLQCAAVPDPSTDRKSRLSRTADLALPRHKAVPATTSPRLSFRIASFADRLKTLIQHLPPFHRRALLITSANLQLIGFSIAHYSILIV